MNQSPLIPPIADATSQRVEFFLLPAPGKRDPHFGLSRGWYYKAAGLGEIKMVAIRQRGALRGVRLVVYDSVCAYIHRTAQMTPAMLAVATAVLGQTSIDSTKK